MFHIFNFNFLQLRHNFRCGLAQGGKGSIVKMQLVLLCQYAIYLLGYMLMWCENFQLSIDFSWLLHIPGNCHLTMTVIISSDRHASQFFHCVCGQSREEARDIRAVLIMNRTQPVPSTGSNFSLTEVTCAGWKVRDTIIVPFSSP